jgi:hypothetical protein
MSAASPARLRLLALAIAALLAGGLAGCKRDAAPPAATAPAPAPAASFAEQHAGDYVVVPLKADLSRFSAKEREMIALLVQASQVMDEIYWQQSWGDPGTLLPKIADPKLRELAEINFGPWDRLNEDTPFVEGIGPRPPGATFYPATMTKEEFEAADLPDKASWYTLLRHDAAGKLITVPYKVAYRDSLEKAAALLRRAAPLSSDKEFGDYLRMRADALLSDDFRPSDMAWMDMKNNPVDIVIGPIESYDDALFGYKAAYEGVVLIKDLAWSAKLARFAAFLPELQRGLPVEPRYKAQMPGSNADLNAYAAVYYGGNANVGGKTIAINLPNDEAVQAAKGTRRLQLENVMQAKFDHILMPIAKVLIAEDQLKHVTFPAFFEGVMFHEVAHGLGIKNTLTGKGTVSAALKDYASSFEEGKADVLGLYLIEALSKKGELPADKMMDAYVTFLAGMLRSVRFGADSAHGKANMVRFRFFEDMGAFQRDQSTGRYRVDAAKMDAAVDALSARLLSIQGDGDYDAAKQMTDSMGVVSPQLQQDLDRLKAAKIPVDVRFEQGLDVLGLAPPPPEAPVAPAATAPEAPAVPESAQ